MRCLVLHRPGGALFSCPYTTAWRRQTSAAHALSVTANSEQPQVYSRRQRHTQRMEFTRGGEAAAPTQSCCPSLTGLRLEPRRAATGAHRSGANGAVFVTGIRPATWRLWCRNRGTGHNGGSRGNFFEDLSALRAEMGRTSSCKSPPNQPTPHTPHTPHPPLPRRLVSQYCKPILQADSQACLPPHFPCHPRGRSET